MASLPHKHYSIIVRGRVQGVGFRYCTLREALHHDITGFVCNHEDGSVGIEAEGTTENLETFVSWCKKGPASAHVDSVALVEGPLVHFDSFEIRKGLFL